MFLVDLIEVNMHSLINTNDIEPLYHKTNKLTCAPSKDSDQPVNPTSRLLHSNSGGSDKTGQIPGLIRVCAGHT